MQSPPERFGIPAARLALASYPDFDPNIFAEGISSKDWASVQSTNPRDSLAPTPLYSIATRTAVQPGSTFKPVTAVAALKAGLDPNRRIYDGRYIEMGGHKFGCSNYNNGLGSHGYQTLAQDEAARPTVRRGPSVGGGAGQMPQAAPKPEDARKPETFRREMPKVGRNDPCPCGSGKKYKNCCMNKDLEQ